MVALSASRLVCRAMAPMVSTMAPTRLESSTRLVILASVASRDSGGLAGALAGRADLMRDLGHRGGQLLRRDRHRADVDRSVGGGRARRIRRQLGAGRHIVERPRRALHPVGLRADRHHDLADVAAEARDHLLQPLLALEFILALVARRLLQLVALNGVFAEHHGGPGHAADLVAALDLVGLDFELAAGQPFEEMSPFQGPDR